MANRIPRGYAKKEGDARKFHPSLRGPVNLQELEIDPKNGMKVISDQKIISSQQKDLTHDVYCRNTWRQKANPGILRLRISSACSGIASNSGATCTGHGRHIFLAKEKARKGRVSLEIRMIARICGRHSECWGRHCILWRTS